MLHLHVSVLDQTCLTTRLTCLTCRPLIREAAKSAAGRALLSAAFITCKPLKTAAEAEALLFSQGQGPWFDMAEGDYPFASTYITYAVGPVR
eukprot:SAG22_NODE_3_length_48349_cov_158.681180_21_plen_92_part_00